MMSNVGRHFRAVIVMGLAWMMAWSAAGGVVARVLDSDLPFPLLFAPFGFAAGIVFSGILEALGSRRALDRVPRSAFAALGAASGIVFAVFVASLRGDALGPEVLVFGPVLALAGGISGAGSLALARRRQSVAM